MWPDYRFFLSLDLSLVMAMTDEARWMIANRLTDAASAPDFMEYVYTDGFQAVRPYAVNIIPLE